MASSHASLTDAVTQALEDLVCQAPKLRRVKHRLWVDMLAVCSGIRPAFLLDYCPQASPRAVQAMCGRLTAQLQMRIYALKWKGCLWVVSHRSLTARLQAALSTVPERPPELWLIDFCQADGWAPPCLRPLHHQAKEHLQQIVRLVACCPGRDASCHDQGLVDLADETSIGNLPFVNGVLLGYPFVYNVTAENVNRASAWLSANPLQLFRQQAIPAGTCNGSRNAPKQAEVNLWTCSAPLHLVDLDNNAVDIMGLWRDWCQHHGPLQPALAGCGWASVSFNDSLASQQVIVL